MQGLPRSVLRHLACLLIRYWNLLTKFSPLPPHFSLPLSSGDLINSPLFQVTPYLGDRYFSQADSEEYLPLVSRDKQSQPHCCHVSCCVLMEVPSNALGVAGWATQDSRSLPSLLLVTASMCVVLIGATELRMKAWRSVVRASQRGDSSRVPLRPAVLPWELLPEIFLVLGSFS